MKKKYKTVYKTSYGTIDAEFKDRMTFEEAEEIGKTYCKDNDYEYLKTEVNHQYVHKDDNLLWLDDSYSYHLASC